MHSGVRWHRWVVDTDHMYVVEETPQKPHIGDGSIPGHGLHGHLRLQLLMRLPLSQSSGCCCWIGQEVNTSVSC